MVVADYLLSGAEVLSRRSSLAAGRVGQVLASLTPEVKNTVLGVDRIYLDAARDAIETRHGSIEGYLNTVLRIGAEDILALRARLLV